MVRTQEKRDKKRDQETMTPVLAVTVRQTGKMDKRLRVWTLMLEPAWCFGKLKMKRTPGLIRLAARSSRLAGGQTLNWKQYLLNRFVEE